MLTTISMPQCVIKSGADGYLFLKREESSRSILRKNPGERGAFGEWIEKKGFFPLPCSLKSDWNF